MNLQQAIREVKEDYKQLKRQDQDRKVTSNFGRIFHPDNLDRLTKEDCKSFLLIKNNKHWDNIHRYGNIVTRDIDRLRGALKILVDEKKPLEQRLDHLFPNGSPNYIKGLGRATITPILLVVYPENYGVYNARTEEGLNAVRLMPKIGRGNSLSKRYTEINEVLKGLAYKNDMSLLQLDVIWWKITRG